MSDNKEQEVRAKIEFLEYLEGKLIAAANETAINTNRLRELEQRLKRLEQKEHNKTEDM